MTLDGLSLEDRAILIWRRRKQLEAQAQRALLSASEDLTVCCLVGLSRLRARADRQAKVLAENGRLNIENAQLRSENGLLRGRLEKIPPRERPYYTPAARFQILEHMKAFLLPVDKTARSFLLTPQTIYNWLAELKRNPEAKAIGCLLDPIPPVRRYHNVVRDLGRQMEAFGFGGDRHIAATLARVGWKVSRRSVGRFCKERPTSPRKPPASLQGRPTTVRGRYPNHLWLADVTRVPLLFPFLHLHLAVVLDAFSRLPLAAALSFFEPSAAAMVALVRRAIAGHGKPKHFVSDQGDQFTANQLRSFLRTLGIRQRSGAIGEHGSIALIERFFRSLKDDLGLQRLRPWSLRDFERRLRPALIRYAYCRPHSALGGRVPAEIYFGLPDQRLLLNSAPRGRPDEPDVECPVAIAFLDPDTATLPILVTKAA